MLKPGDILITNVTKFKGIFGHAAIAISDSEVVHIAGPFSYPNKISFNGFKKKYLKSSHNWIKIYRSKSKIKAELAAEWVNDNYAENENIKYFITRNLKSTNYTYCSKIVFQAYLQDYDKNNYIIPKKLPNLLSLNGVDIEFIKEIKK